MSNIYNSGDNNIEENQKEGEPLGILNLEIEKGVVKQIKLYKNSNPEEVSFAFCKENNIDFSLMGQIKNEIEELMEKYYQASNKDKNVYQENNNVENNNNKNNIYNNNILNSDEYNSYQIFNKSKNNIYNNNNQMNNRKLFFYQYLQEQKQRKPSSNKANSVNKYKINVFNTLNNTKKNKKKVFIPESKNIRYTNDSYLTRNFNTINNNSNIFDRLYNDAKIKRIVYKRPCHYGNDTKENNIFQDDISDVFETINGTTINKKTLDMNPSYIRSYQIKPNKLLNNECSFHPNSKYNNTNNYSYQMNNTYNSNNLNEERVSYSKNNKNVDIINYYQTNNLNFNKNINSNALYEENYVPLKNKTKFFSNFDENNLNIIDNMEILSNEAFNNIFKLLINNEQNQILNKNTININNIDNNTVLILSSIIQDINNNDIELDLDNFINRLSTELSNYDKKYLILNYSNISSNNNNSNYYSNNNTKHKFNTITKNFQNKNKSYNSSNKYSHKKSKTLKMFNINKNYRLPSGTEKKKHFYYL